jgi:hypothetical protein
MLLRWPSQNTFGMWTVPYWRQSSRTQFGVAINVWKLAGDTLNITCNFLYCNYQVHRDFLITLCVLSIQYWCVGFWTPFVFVTPCRWNLGDETRSSFFLILHKLCNGTVCIWWTVWLQVETDLLMLFLALLLEWLRKKNSPNFLSIASLKSWHKTDDSWK